VHTWQWLHMLPACNEWSHGLSLCYIGCADCQFWRRWFLWWSTLDFVCFAYYILSPQNTSNPNFQYFNPNFYWSSSCLVGQIMSSSCEVKTQVQVKSSFAGVRSLPSMKSSAFSHVHCLIPSLYMFVYIYICLYHCWFTYANLKNSYCI
jgi:hypothetical protein